MFYTGQKVVHIGFQKHTWGEWWYMLFHPYPKGPDPVIGSVYTVIFVPTSFSIEIVEIPTIENKWWDPGFLNEGFRPVVERKTDISVFTSLLNPANHKKILEHETGK